jgi:hypothetical protein
MRTVGSEPLPVLRDIKIDQNKKELELVLLR